MITFSDHEIPKYFIFGNEGQFTIRSVYWIWIDLTQFGRLEYLTAWQISDTCSVPSPHALFKLQILLL